MNHLEIFQEVYGKDHVFTVTELTQLQKVAELIARECANIADVAEPYKSSDLIKEHFGVKK